MSRRRSRRSRRSRRQPEIRPTQWLAALEAAGADAATILVAQAIAGMVADDGTVEFDHETLHGGDAS